MKVIFRVIEFERRKSALGHERTLIYKIYVKNVSSFLGFKKVIVTNNFIF
jgi:hypothetical protein